MNAETQGGANGHLPASRQWARTAYRLLAWLFLAGIGVQIFLAGMGLFVGPDWWLRHKGFVHLLEALPVLMLILAFVGRLPVAMRWRTAATFGLIGVQYATIEIGLPTLAAFHPVTAVLLFWLTLTLSQGATRLNGGNRIMTGSIDSSLVPGT